MRHGSARKVFLFAALVALGTVIGIVLTRPAWPHTRTQPAAGAMSDRRLAGASSTIEQPRSRSRWWIFPKTAKSG